MEDAFVTALVILAAIIVFLVWFRRSSSTGKTINRPFVVDGDTIFSNGKSYRIHGIDAPEMAQHGGVAARVYLSNLIRRGQVSVEFMDKDRYGRPVVRLFSKGGDIGRRMVEDGYARAYFHEDYRKHELQAKRQKRGLWAVKGGMVDPVRYRREMKGRRR